MHNSLLFKHTIAIFLGAATALIISALYVRPVLADYQLRDDVKRNCAAFKSPPIGEPIDIRSIDPETGLMYVNQPSDGFENVVPLNYKMSDSDAGCNDGAKFLFQKVREVEKKQVADTCADFQDILSGKKPNAVRNGEAGNLDAARSFVKKHCK